MPDMLTRWGRDLDPQAVLPEHPRPQLARESHLSLNGVWEHAFTPVDAAQPTAYDGEILVPFSPEAPLSGVGRQLGPDELLWYRRRLVLPAGFRNAADDRVLLHFGAVDQTATVWLDGVEVGGHHGGYLPFTCDLTDVLAGRDEATLVVRVRDLGGNRGPSSGKQRFARGGIWYTAQSGIWQTVWAEAVPATYVDRLDLEPLLEREAVRVLVTTAGGRPGTGLVRILDGGREVARAAVTPGTAATVALPGARPWTPEDPHLYDVEVSLGADRVTGFFGMRSLGIGPDGHGVPRLLLNGRPYLHVGVLDQGYWPDGLMTAPSDAAVVHDLATAKRLGFTMVRKHLKVEPLRWYAHCDRLGLLVWQDLVNGGGRYRTAAVTWPGRRWGRPLRHLRDDTRVHRALLGRADPQGRAEFRDELRRTVAHLRGVTSLAVWVPFNEGWGQFDAAVVAAELRHLDPTRAVDHASGWHDQGAGDLVSLHVYGRRFVPPRRRRTERRVLALTEYGGHALPVPGHTWGADTFGYRTHDGSEDYAAWFERVHRDELAAAVPAGLAATVFTQLTDVEDEVNGLLTYDREVLKAAPGRVRAALDALRRAAGGR